MGINNYIHILLCITLGIFIMLITIIVAWKKQVKRNDQLHDFNNYLLDHLFRIKNNDRGNNS